MGIAALATRTVSPGVDNPTTLLPTVTSATPTTPCLHPDDPKFDDAGKCDDVDGVAELVVDCNEAGEAWLRLRLYGRVLLSHRRWRPVLLLFAPRCLRLPLS